MARILKREAKRLGVVYTLGAGDEPSSCMELVNFVQGLGYPIVAAGKGKNNPLNIAATPEEYAEEAKRRNMNVRMLVEFVDGSKTMVEMAAISKATGLVPDIAGMHDPAATLTEPEHVLCPKKDGGILSRKGVVDFSVGKGVTPGVFVIAEMAHPRLRERLDSIGEYTYRAWIMTVGEADAANGVPCGLIENGKVTKAIKKGELLIYANIAIDTSAKIVSLRKRQDDALRSN